MALSPTRRSVLQLGKKVQVLRRWLGLHRSWIQTEAGNLVLGLGENRHWRQNQGLLIWARSLLGPLVPSQTPLWGTFRQDLCGSSFRRCPLCRIHCNREIRGGGMPVFRTWPT